MQRKKSVIAMLLAGGQGSRLYVLTEKMAKPAVHFGGKYRIIDFPLSNCINSGIDTVGVLTQYQPLELNEYIGNGQPWDLDRDFGGVQMLPPYLGSQGGEWYKGTANAIYQNLSFMRRYHPDYVVILSGDHIYKMDYQKMVDYHIEKGADCTIAVLEVSLEEASRFGIMNTRDDNTIYEFEEKPAKPKSTKASMGVYVFTAKKLYDYLAADEADADSANDFGKNVLPAMLAAGEKMVAYPFSGYWKDVGTIASLWEANMDLLGERPAMDLNDPRWKIFFRHHPRPPQAIEAGATIHNSLIAEGCRIEGTVENSVIFPGVHVGKGAIVRDSVLMEDAVLGEGATVDYTIADVGVTIGQGARVGRPRAEAKGIAVLAARVTVQPGADIADDTMTKKEVR